MELKNGYKVIYDKSANGEHVLYASKTGVFAEAEELVRIAAGEYKLVYEKAGKFYGSKNGIPAEGDYCFEEFNKVLTEVEASNEPDVINEESTTDHAAEGHEVVDETPVEDEEPEAGETEE